MPSKVWANHALVRSALPSNYFQTRPPSQWQKHQTFSLDSQAIAHVSHQQFATKIMTAVEQATRPYGCQTVLRVWVAATQLPA